MASGKKKKVFDVSRPGTTLPSPTARPLITSHKTLAALPYSGSDSKSGSLPFKKTPRINIQPTHSDFAANKAGEKAQEVTDATTEPQAETVPEAVAADSVSSELSQAPTESAQDADTTVHDSIDKLQTFTAPPHDAVSTADEPVADQDVTADQAIEDTQTTDQTSSSVDSGAATVNAIVDEASKRKETKEDKEVQKAVEAARHEAIQKLVESKQYFVTITEPKRRRSARWLLTAIALVVLLAVAAYSAIDAGIIKTGFQLPYHFFK